LNRCNNAENWILLNGDFPVHLLTLEQLVNEIKVSIFIEQVTESDQLNGSLFHLLSAGWWSSW